MLRVSGRSTASPASSPGWAATSLRSPPSSPVCLASMTGLIRYRFQVHTHTHKHTHTHTRTHAHAHTIGNHKVPEKKSQEAHAECHHPDWALQCFLMKVPLGKSDLSD